MMAKIPRGKEDCNKQVAGVWGATELKCFVQKILLNSLSLLQELRSGPAPMLPRGLSICHYDPMVCLGRNAEELFHALGMETLLGFVWYDYKYLLFFF